MAMHLSIGRIPSILLLALLAVAAGTAYYQFRSEPGTAPAAQIPASRIPASGPKAPAIAETRSAELPPAAETGAAKTGAAKIGAEPRRSRNVRNSARSTLRARNPGPIPRRAPSAARARVLLLALYAVAARTAQNQSRPKPETAPGSQVPAPQIPAAIARLTTEPQRPPHQRPPVVQDPDRSTLHATNPAPIPTPVPRAAKAEGIAAIRAAKLFQSGAEIKIKKDANLYITSRNIPENDRWLAGYNVDRVRTRLGEAAAMPGLLGIASQTNSAQDPKGRNAQTYTLADAMRDVIWRKNTAARLKSLTISQNACAGGIGAKTPSIGLLAGC